MDTMMQQTFHVITCKRIEKPQRTIWSTAMTCFNFFAINNRKSLNFATIRYNKTASSASLLTRYIYQQFVHGWGYFHPFAAHRHLKCSNNVIIFSAISSISVVGVYGETAVGTARADSATSSTTAIQVDFYVGSCCRGSSGFITAAFSGLRRSGARGRSARL